MSLVQNGTSLLLWSFFGANVTKFTISTLLANICKLEGVLFADLGAATS